MNLNSETLTIRISKEQQAALAKLTPPLTASTILRALLKEYLAGSLPEWVDAKVLLECSTAVEARKKVRFKSGHKPWNSTAGAIPCQSNPKKSAGAPIQQQQTP